MRMKFVSLLLLLVKLCSVATEKIEVVNEWKVIEYDFPDDAAKQSAIDNKMYIPGNSVPVEATYWEKDGKGKLFLTIPNVEGGVPASLVTVTDKDGEKGGKLVKPYPDYSWHNGERKCDGLTSVFGTSIDECGRLWVLDAGRDDVIDDLGQQVCHEQIFLFDLETDKLLKKYQIPMDVLKEKSLISTLVVDIRDPQEKCEDAFVYIADNIAYGIIVFDVKNAEWWRVEDDSMAPDPKRGKFTVAGVEIKLPNGITTIALTPAKNNDRIAYYHPIASVTENWVPTSVLRKASNFNNGEILDKSQFEKSENARSSQASGEVFDSNGILYFSPLTESSIKCYNSEKPYTKENLYELYKDEEKLQFVTRVKNFKNQQGAEFLYLVSNRFQLVKSNMLKMDEVNFRVIKGNIAELTKGTGCEK